MSDVHMEEPETVVKTTELIAKVVVRTKLWKIAKIVLPHLLLSLFMVCYVALGSVIFNAIEYDHDVQQSTAKSQRIAAQYKKILDHLQSSCPSHEHSKESYDKFRGDVHALLVKISELHENRNLSSKSGEVGFTAKPKWSFMDGCLYALSILTTTGYVNATPSTSLGQIVTVIYGLFGIPLMFLVAVDIGRFMSDVVLGIYPRMSRFWQSRVFAKRKAYIAEEQSQSNPATEDEKDVLLANDSTLPKTTEPSTKIKSNGRNKLPLWATVSILLLFNTVGAFVYMAYGDPRPINFFEAFFACFNLVANLTMAEIPVVTDSIMFFYIAFFVTFGLAVLSMCADLAASKLKWLFTYIHYFGRRMRKTRRLIADVSKYCDNAEELKELLHIIESIRRKYPLKHKITHKDILEFMKNDDDFINWRLLAMAKRRDTIAFVPQEMERLRYADEDENMVAAAASLAPALSSTADAPVNQQPTKPITFSSPMSAIDSIDGDDEVIDELLPMKETPMVNSSIVRVCVHFKNEEKSAEGMTDFLI